MPLLALFEKSLPTATWRPAAVEMSIEDGPIWTSVGGVDLSDGTNDHPPTEMLNSQEGGQPSSRPSVLMMFR